MVVSGDQVRALTENGHMYSRMPSNIVTHEITEESKSRLSRHGLFIGTPPSVNGINTDSVRCAEMQGMANRGQPAGEPRTMIRHSVSNFLQDRDPTTNGERKLIDAYDQLMKSSISSPMSVSNNSSYQSTPYVPPMISPISPPSYPPLPASALLTLQTPPNSSTLSPNLSRELITELSSSMCCTSSPASSPTSDNARDTFSSLAKAWSATPGLSSSKSLSPSADLRHSSPGLSSSRDSGFSSPSSVNANGEIYADNEKTSGETLPNKKETQKVSKRISKRTNFSSTQTEKLHRLFDDNPYPDHETMEDIGKELNMSEKQVKIWFQNKRARHRRRKDEKSNCYNNAMQMQRIYSPMTSLGYPSPVSMATATTYPTPSSVPMYLPAGQGQSPQNMTFQAEQVRNYPNNSHWQSWKPFCPITMPYGNFETRINHRFVPVQNTWQGTLRF